MQNLESLLKPIKNSADWVALKFFSEKTTMRSLRNEAPDRNATEWDIGVRVEVLVDGQFGYAGTSDLTPDGVSRAFEGGSGSRALLPGASGMQLQAAGERGIRRGRTAGGRTRLRTQNQSHGRFNPTACSTNRNCRFKSGRASRMSRAPTRRRWKHSPPSGTNCRSS